MNKKHESDDSQGHIQIQSNSSRNIFKSKTYTKLKNSISGSKKVTYNHSPRIQSNNNTTSKYNSIVKNHSTISHELVKHPQTNDLNHIAIKYECPGAMFQKLKQQLNLILDRKTSEIQALQVQRDQLILITQTCDQQKPIKISLAVLKQKSKLQSSIRDKFQKLKKDKNRLQTQIQMLRQYQKYVRNTLHTNKQQIFNSKQQQKLLIYNCSEELQLAKSQFDNLCQKNSKQIRNIQTTINNLRIIIKNKEDTIRQLKSKICSLHIKLHHRPGSSSRQKNMSISIKKFNIQNNQTMSQAFIGNKVFKNYSRQFVQKVPHPKQLTQLNFFYDHKNESLSLQCVYDNQEGKNHSFQQTKNQKNKIKMMLGHRIKDNSKNYKSESNIYQVLKYFSRIKSQVWNSESKLSKDLKIFKLDFAKLQHELLTLVNKKLITLSSFWHNKDMIGIGVWFCAKTIRPLSKSESQKKTMHSSSRSKDNFKTPTNPQIEYYNGYQY